MCFQIEELWTDEEVLQEKRKMVYRILHTMKDGQIRPRLVLNRSLVPVPTSNPLIPMSTELARRFLLKLEKLGFGRLDQRKKNSSIFIVHTPNEMSPQAQAYVAENAQS